MLLRKIACLAAVLFCALSMPAYCQDAELMLWLKADDLVDRLDDGEPVGVWPDASGRGRDARAEGDFRPVFRKEGASGEPAVAFAADSRTQPRKVNRLTLPLEGEWRGATIFAVGMNLEQSTWFGSAPGRIGEMRLIGGIQHCNMPSSPTAKLNMQHRDGLRLVALTAALDDDCRIRLRVHVDGDETDETVSDPVIYGLLFGQPHLGAYIDWNGLNGEMTEVLIYRGALSDSQRKRIERYLMARHGLAPARDDDPAQPVGYPLPAGPQPQPQPVAAAPVTADLRLWAAADSIDGAADGDRISTWPAAEGEALTSHGDARPTYVAQAINNRPAIRFAGDDKTNPPVRQRLDLPLGGACNELTLLIVGRNLNRPGLFDFAAGKMATLRHIGGIQHCGSGISLPFPKMLNLLPQAQLFALEYKVTADGVSLKTFANGVPAGEAAAPAERVKSAFRFENPRIGDVIGGAPFAGEIAEILIYDRALSNSERAQTEGYLAEKYDLVMPTERQAENARSKFSLNMPHIPSTMTWAHNTFPGETAWMQTGASDLCVLADGTVIACSVWDEAHKEIGWYKDGKIVPGRGKSGGTASLITDDRYIYIGKSGMGGPKSGVARLTADGDPAPWPAEDDYVNQRGWKIGKAVWFDVPAPWCEVQGMAILDDELFVSVKAMHELKVFDLATGKLNRIIKMDAQPGKMAANAEKLWLIVGDEVREIDTDGAPTGKTITGLKPSGVTFAPDGRLLVADSGDRQQIVTFDVTGAQPQEVGALGERGGVMGAPRRGHMSPWRLWNPKDVETDAAGNVYVLGPLLLRCYLPDGQMQWQLEATSFCTVGDFDPATDGRDIYTGDTHYSYVPNQPPGKDWAWTGVTKNPAYGKLAGDGQYIIMRRFNGRLYRFLHKRALEIQVQEPNSETFRPVAIYCGDERADFWRPDAAPESGRYAWTDLDGDAQVETEEISVPPAGDKRPTQSFDLFIDDTGGLWEPGGRWGIYHIPCQGFSESGAPIYDLKAEEKIWRPAEFKTVDRVYYFPKTDTMYLSGNTWANPANGNETWGGCGRECIRYDNWSTPDRTLTSRMVYPKEAWTIRAMHVLHEADRLFAGECGTAVIFTYNTTTGELLGILEPDVSMFGPSLGWLDHSGAVRAFGRNNGAIRLLVEDCMYGKAFIYDVEK